MEKKDWVKRRQAPHPTLNDEGEDTYSMDDKVTQEMKKIEARWWPRELALMQELAGKGLLTGYVRATRQHRRRSHSGRTLPHPWHLTEPGGDWWIKFHRTEATVLQQFARRQSTLTSLRDW